MMARRSSRLEGRLGYSVRRADLARAAGRREGGHPGGALGPIPGPGADGVGQLQLDQIEHRVRVPGKHPRAGGTVHAALLALLALGVVVAVDHGAAQLPADEVELVAEAGHLVGRVLVPGVLILTGISVVYGAFCACVKTDLKYINAYSSVSHCGLVLFAILMLNRTACTGAVLQMLSHGLMTALFFALIGMIYGRT